MLLILDSIWNAITQKYPIENTTQDYYSALRTTNDKKNTFVLIE